LCGGIAVLQELGLRAAAVWTQRIKNGHKKTARLGWRFFGKLGFYDNNLPLSIRQRLEMPKKVKIKFGGHIDLARRSESRLAL
jgi:hypothetical protein